jgi:hypothetical protein
MIIFKPYGSEIVNLIGQADSGVASIGIWINAKSYIKVTGVSLGQLNLSKMAANIIIGPWTGQYPTGDSSHNEISYVYAYNGGEEGWSAWWQGSVVWKRAYYNRIHHCKFKKFGYLRASTGGHKYNLFDLGAEFANEDSERTMYNIIENN